MRHVLNLSALFLNILQLVACYPSFSKLIPNGEQVPNPCDRTSNWKAVGHEWQDGPGPRNVFGLDFLKANQTWTLELCQKDSDGDGKTNGEELGDPSCVWTVGSTPSIIDRSKLSHPGVCEPSNSQQCQGSKFDACKQQQQNSDADWCPMIRAPFVQSMLLQFEKTQLPDGREVFHLCKEFTLPSDTNYHIIAWEPVIDNAELAHHLSLYACEQSDEEAVLEQMGGMKNVSECKLVPTCSALLLTWSGQSVPRRCYGNEVGIPMGRDFFKTVILQFHYNNFDLLKNEIDSSGLRIYYTPVLRPNEKGMIAVGQSDIAIPPRSKDFVVKGEGFAGWCSEKQLAPYKSYRIISVLWHMHLIGVYGKLTLTKNSTGERLSLIDEPMQYHRTKFVSWDAGQQPILEPGDSLSIECRYDASRRSNWTLFGGYSAADEMCMAFIDVYPRPQKHFYQMPVDLGPLSFCDVIEPQIGNCSKNTMAGILQNTERAMLKKASSGLMADCFCPGAFPTKTCTSSCYAFLSRTGLLTNPCMTGMAFHAITRNWLATDPKDIYQLQAQTDACVRLGPNNPPPENTLCRSATPANGRNNDSNDDGGSGEENFANNLSANFFLSVTFFIIVPFLVN